MASRTCVGCDIELTNDIISREHILPQWLAEVVRLPGVSVNHYRHDEQEDSDELLRSYDLNNFVVKNVCRSCNNGWMGQLEGRAKPFILALMNKKLGLLELPIDVRITLSRWAVKTAFMIASAQQGRINLPWHIFQTLKDEGRGPGNCFVVAVQLPQLPKGFTFAHQPEDLSPAEESVQVRVGFSINNLQFVVIIPIVEAPRALLLAAGVHIPLWPLDVQAFARYERFDKKLDSAADLVNFLTGLVQAGLVRPR